MFEFIKGGNLPEESLKLVIDCICDVHLHWKMQEQIVDNIIQV